MKDQLVLDPSLAPPDNPEIKERLHAWLDAKDSQRTAAESTRLRHDVLIAKMVELGIDRYPYVDAITGKRKHVVADRTPKAKVVNAPSPKKRRDVEPDDATPPANGSRKSKDVAPSEQVESRRVPRTKEHDDLADPFAAQSPQRSEQRPLRRAARTNHGQEEAR